MKQLQVSLFVDGDDDCMCLWQLLGYTSLASRAGNDFNPSSHNQLKMYSKVVPWLFFQP